MENPNRDPLAQKRHSEHCAKAAFLLSFNQGVFKISQNIDDMNWLALKQNSACYRPPTRLHWQSFDVLVVTGRVPIIRHKMVVRTSLTSDRRHLCLTKSGGRFDQRLKH